MERTPHQLLSLRREPRPSLAGTRVAVVGLGASGLAAVELLRRAGATVLGNDLRQDVALRRSLEAVGATSLLGRHDPELLAAQELIVVSPGVPPLPLFDSLARRVPIVSELELASWFLAGTLVAVTGTNGKSTVTTLIGAMVARTAAERGASSFVGGNLGIPLSQAVLDDTGTGPGDTAVVEVSSFQLERIHHFHPRVALLLNVTPDHLDRYPSLAQYAAAKGRLFLNQERSDVAIIPEGNVFLRSLAASGRARLSTFGPSGDVVIDGDHLVDRVSGLAVPVAALALKGAKNAENACAAALAARHLGVAKEVIAEVLTSLSGLPHRMVLVVEREGVAYYDDSKGTNVGAATAAVEGLAVTGRVILLAGGVHKGGGYDPLVAAMQRRGRVAVLFGEAAARMCQAFEAGGVPAEVVPDLAAAVERARAYAKPGDGVLLSPACASFDMFKNYRERGERFQEIVRGLGETRSLTKRRPP